MKEMDSFGKFIRSHACAQFSDLREWWWLSYDQLNTEFLPDNKQIGVLLIESLHKGQAKPYHKQKLCLVLSNMRHFAVELIELGYHVKYVCTSNSYAEYLESIRDQISALHLCRPAELSLRKEIKPFIESKFIHIHPHPGWLTQREWFESSVGSSPPFRMDRFYQRVRKELNVLMENGSPLGGKYSHDAENRLAWKGEPPVPPLPIFDFDTIDEEVVALVERNFPSHPGVARLDIHPTSSRDLERAVQHAIDALPNFGPFEDAFSEQSRSLFHTKLAPVLNLHRILPKTMMDVVVQLDMPLSSKEGYFRQLIWREYVFHIHDVTDGFAHLDVKQSLVSNRTARWNDASSEPELHANQLQQSQPLPQAFWGKKSSLRCLDTVVEQVLDEAWTHHIPRLMVLSNIANLLDIQPRELTDWFHIAFVDAFDWVVEPNVLGMGTFALGDAMMTKPYVSGSAYIHRMGDSCSSCAFNPKKDCPITPLYWQFFERHKDEFTGNHRLAMTLKTLERRSQEQKDKDLRIFNEVQSRLSQGLPLIVSLSDVHHSE
jgi:deoxyribodipyrimidine photolyase-related protein